MPQKSKMWFYFKRVDDSTVSCNLCTKHIKSSGNTSNMMKHLSMHNKNVGADRRDDKSKEVKLPVKRKRRSTDRALYDHWLEQNDTETSHAGTSCVADVEEKPLSVQVTASPIAAFEKVSSYSDSEDRYAQISDAILYFICVDNRPFDTIQCEGFRHLMKELAPLYTVPTKDTIKKRLDEKYDAVAQVFKQKLSETSYMTITTDVWSDTMSSKSYLGVVVHFIANGVGKLESGNIEVTELSEHTGDYMACSLLSALTKWDIDISKVIAVVTNDEASTVNAVTRTFGRDRHIVCFAHAINLVAENCLKNCEGLGSVIDKVRSIVRFARSNVSVNDELHQRQIDAGVPEDERKKLILDVKTRWNSTFHMMERFIELWSAISEIVFAKHETPERLTVDELIVLREILELLRPLEFVARECSAEKYIMVSKVIPLVSCTLTEYKKTVQTTELSTRLKEIILAELETRFSHIEFVNTISFATILDPRFKTIHFRNAQALTNAMYLLRDTLNELSNASSSGESDAEQEESTKYDLWIHHRFLAHKPKEEKDDALLRDELSLYLASPLASLKDDPLEKWESMRMLYPTLYKVATKYLSIVATSIPADRLFSKAGLAIAQSRNQLAGKRLRKLLFLNSVHQEYWFQ